MLPTVLWSSANTVNAAAEQMLGFLGETPGRNVIYFRGWDGLAASATLRVVAQRLKSSKLYDKVIHVDCSVWKNMRTVQKIVAEELELPQSVMAIFHQRDGDDDFHGIDQGSRGELAEVSREIFKSLANVRYAVIFHNGSDKYVDLSKCGILLYEYVSYRLFWTFQGRFRRMREDIHKYEELMGNTTYCMDHGPSDSKDGRTLWGLVHEEAEEVVEYISNKIVDHKIVEECILYMWALRGMSGIHWETHASNYWVCDGIVQDKAWEIGDALQSYIHLDWDWKRMGHAVPFSTTHLQPRQQPISNTTSVPPEATSFFLSAAHGLHTVHTKLPDGMFQHSDSKLRVLHLSCCTFNFASPPFLCCSNLRFLLLDHCINTTEGDQHQNHRDSGSWRACFGNLWVLDLSYTNWYWLLSEEMINLMVELRELNVKGVKNWSVSDLHGGVSLIKLRVTTNPILMEDDDMDNRAPFLDLSHAIDLKTIILDGCVELEQVVPEGLPPLLESFSFINNDVTTAKISSISFRGHAHFKSLLLRGLLGNLSELDLSDTTVKTLDLRSVQAQNLKRLILLGCEKLRAILWPPEDKMPRVLEVLRIDTTQSASSAVAAAAKLGSGGATTSFDFNGYISVRDARLLRSLELEPIFDYSKRSYVHIEIDSSPNCCVVDSGSKGDQRIKSLQQPAHHLYTRDVLAVLEDHLHASAANEGAVSWMWACPPMPATNEDSHRNWYVHIQDDLVKSQIQWQQQQGSTQGTSTSVLFQQDVIYNSAKVLHVHDSSFINSIRNSWWALQWCRVKRCPKLGSVFTTNIGDNIDFFPSLRTFWASELLEARYIWNSRGSPNISNINSFGYLRFLHLDYCPRLIHVLPLGTTADTLHDLETLELVCCGDLREVFPLDHKRQKHKAIVEFPNLKRIHLHELPMLQCICEHGISTPKLEMIKLRGCWSLNRLPAVGDKTEAPKVEVDCEKEWWDGLEWDGVEANHHPSLYKLSHCPYYKKADLPRGTLLR